MAVTLRQLYDEIRQKEEILLVAGDKGLDRDVHWIHMVEGASISDFLEGDELAFTTGVALNSKEELFELVQITHKKNATGMVINIGPFIKEIPQTVIDFANENGFPIFSVPWRVHMANIMRYISMQITLDEQKNMEFASALKNAVYFSDNEELYVPTFLKYGYKKEWSYCVANLQICDRTLNPIHEKDRSRALNLIQRAVRNENGQVLVQEIDKEFIFFCHNYSEQKVKLMINRVWKEIAYYLPSGTRYYGGIGRMVKNINEIGKCYRQAIQVRSLQRQRHQKNVCVSYNTLGVYKLLLAVENEELMNEYYEELLGPLERYDRINETDYYYFLKQYFECDCSTQVAAKNLHLHRNSVIYKLHKCEEILGIEINNQRIRTELMIAFMMKEIQ